MLRPLARLDVPAPLHHNIVCTLVLAALFLNEALGSLLLYGAFAIVMFTLATWPRYYLEVLFRRRTLYFWLVPLLALASVLWSPVPQVTLRAGIQLALTVIMAAVLTSICTPREIRRNIFIVVFIIVVLSFLRNNYSRDGMTNAVNWTGLYANKNTMCFIGACFTLCCTANFLSERRVSNIGWLWALGMPVGFGICIYARSIAIIGVLTPTVLLLFALSTATNLNRKVQSQYVEMLSVGLISAAVVGSISVILFQDTLLALANKDPTLTGRTVLWYWADRMIDGHFWLGYGYKGFWIAGSAVPEYLWKMFHIDSRMGFHFHSLYYEIFIELGAIGVLLASLTIFYALYNGYLWVARTASIDSMFYLSVLIAIIVLQTQSVDLFMEFQTQFLLFQIGASFAATLGQHPASYGTEDPVRLVGVPPGTAGRLVSGG